MEKLRKIQPKKIAILRALQLGDLMCAIPAVRALKQALPTSKITLLGLPWAKGFTKRFSNYFSRFIHFPGYPGLPEQSFTAKDVTNFIQKIQKEKFDLIIQMHGNGSIINPLIELLGASTTAGYYMENSFYPNNNLFMPYPEGVTEIEKHIQLINYLGIPVNENELEFPISSLEEVQFKTLCAEHKLDPGKYVCLHPGTRDFQRRWPHESFARVGDAIAMMGCHIVLTGTIAEERICKNAEKEMKLPSINLAGKTNLGTFAALIKNAKMIFSNETGVSHLAAATKTPSIIVFLTSDPSRWASLNKNLHHIISPDQSDDMKLILEKTEFLISTIDEMEQLKISTSV